MAPACSPRPLPISAPLAPWSLTLWAGQDLGPVAAGYSNNAALGRLILDGLTNTTQFWFQPATGTPATGTNALYVDYLEFRDYMTNFDHSGNLANLKFSSGHEDLLRPAHDQRRLAGPKSSMARTAAV